MNDAQIFMQSLVENATAACRTLIEENNKNYVDKKFKNFKVDGSQIKANTTPSTAIKDDTLHLAKFKYLQSDFASFFAVETNTLLADWVKTGHLNTEDVQIYAGSNLRFLINGEGIFGFHSPSAGVIDTTSYVKFSESGVTMVKNDITLIELDWNGMRFFELENGVAYESLIADSTGKLWLKRGLRVGIDPYDSIYINGTDGTIGSSMYSSGQIGAGWRISKDGSAEFNNARIRGTLSTAVFEHSKNSTVAGSLYVSCALISAEDSPISTVTVDTTDYYSVALTFPFSGEDHYASGQNWTVGDILSVQGLIELSTGVYEIRDFRCKISAFTETGCTLQSLDPISSIIAYDEDTGAPFEAGSITLTDGNITPNSAFIFIGSVGTNGEILRRGILISATDNNSPYIDVYDSTEDDTMPKVRIGNLNGINDGRLRVQPSGHGAYLGNVFAVGHGYFNGGSIGGYNIDAHTLSTLDGKNGIGDGDASSPAGDYIFWAGNIVPSEAPYRVDKEGHLFIGSTSGDHLSYDGESLDMQVRSLTIKTENATLAMGDVVDSITNDITDLKEFKDEQQAIVYLDELGVHVGQRDYLAQTIVSPDGLHIKDNMGAEGAYFTNGQCYIQNAQFTSTMQIGNFQYKTYSSGRVAIRKA